MRCKLQDNVQEMTGNLRAPLLQASRKRALLGSGWELIALAVVVGFPYSSNIWYSHVSISFRWSIHHCDSPVKLKYIGPELLNDKGHHDLR